MTAPVPLRSDFDAEQLRALGKVSRDAAQTRRLLALVEQGTLPAAHGVVRWRLVDLTQILFEDHGVAVSEQTLSWELRARAWSCPAAPPRR